MTHELTCLCCGKKFKADRKSRKFCSHSCSGHFRVVPENGVECPNNQFVNCYDLRCDKCGWNPVVAKARLDKFLGRESDEG